jgi:hypothetical protein
MDSLDPNRLVFMDESDYATDLKRLHGKYFREKRLVDEMPLLAKYGALRQ